MKKVEEELKEKMAPLSKVEHMSEEPFEMKEYVKDKVIEDARTMFLIRSHMIDVKFNFKNDGRYSRELWSCEGCHRTVETQTHVLNLSLIHI